MLSSKTKVLVCLGDPSLPDPIKLGGKFNPEDIEVFDKLKEALRLLSDYEFEYLTNHHTLFQDILDRARQHRFDYVLNFCDEGLYNDMNNEVLIPRFLEEHKIPYTGCPADCLSTCYQKSNIRARAQAHGIPVATGLVIRPADDLKALGPEIARLPYPMFVKPDFGGGSFGITTKSIVHNPDELVEMVTYVRKLLAESKRILDVVVEKYLAGQEITAAIIGNGDAMEVNLLQENFSILPQDMPRIITYDGKWNPASVYWNLTSMKPNIPEAVFQKILKYSPKMFQALQCHDYARFDWRLEKENGNPYLMEVNPNCGWCWDAHMIKAFSIMPDGKVDIGNPITYSKVLHKILKVAEKRLFGKDGGH